MSNRLLTERLFPQSVLPEYLSLGEKIYGVRSRTEYISLIHEIGVLTLQI